MLKTVKVEAQIKPAMMRCAFGKTGTIEGRTKQMIAERLGFSPNVLNNRWSPDHKVKNEWSFEIAGRSFAIWDWHPSGENKVWSTYGDHSVLAALFEEDYRPER